MIRIDSARFLQDLNAVADIGRLPQEQGGGRDRRPFSAAERMACHFVASRAQEAGLTVTIDAAANLSLILPCSRPDAPTLLIGSHLDTVPHGGPYDGALGVLAGLEVLRAIGEAGLDLPWHLEAMAFTDEEGRFGNFFGSRALTGLLTGAEIDTFLTRAGAYPEDLVGIRGQVPGALTAQSIKQAARQAADLAGYLEIHIEQGPRLEHMGIPIGVVTAIFGRTSLSVRFIGRPDHAGTTPLDLRADALVAAANFISGARTLVRQAHPDAVITCGGVGVEPGVFNVVPGQVDVLVEYRAARQETLSAIETLLQDLAASVCDGPDLAFSIEPNSDHAPVPMDIEMQSAIHAACERLDHAYLDLPSGAGHDALVLASLTPAGMIFTPSKGGRSHCPDEDTDPDDLVAGAETLLQTVLVLAERAA